MSQSVTLSSSRNIEDLQAPLASMGPSDVGEVGDEDHVTATEDDSNITHGTGVDPVSPPLAQWLVIALFCALSYALYNVFIKKSSASIHPILGGVILQFVAAILGTILCLTLAFGPSQEDMFYDNPGVMWAVLAGVSVGIAEIISFTVSGMGVPAVQSIPIIIGGSVMFGTVICRLFLGEILSPQGWVGVVMIATGICLVGM